MSATPDLSCFMLRAIGLARQGMLAGDGGPFGAVVVKDGEVVGQGWNRVLSSNDPTAHGEISAIRDACSRLGRFDLPGCEIYTTGEPCPMCLGAIHWARIRRIYYGFSVSDAATVGFDDLSFHREAALAAEERKVRATPLAVAEARALLDDYRQLPERRRY